MRRTRRTGVLAIAASLALTAGGVVAVLPAAAGGPTVFIDGGQLTLQTGGTPTVSYVGTEYAGSSQPLETETTQPPLAASGCDFASPTSGPLLAFTGYLDTVPTTQPRVGFKNGSIGVNEETDSLCSRVDAISRTGKTEYLDVALSDKLVNYGGRPLLAKSASLDIEVKQSGLFNTTRARIEATARFGGNNVGTFTLIQGKAPSTPAANTFYCNVGDTQNCQWTITLPAGEFFDTLRLRAVSAGFSLEGGSDGAPAMPTAFELVSEVDKAFACAKGESLTNPDGTKVTYVGTAGSEVCEGFGVVLESSDQEVRFLKPLTVTPDAQFIFDVKWKLDRPTTPGFALPEATIDFEFKDDDRAESDRVSDMLFCPDYLYTGTGASRTLTGLTKPPAGDDTAAYDAALQDLQGRDMVSVTDAASAVGTQYACIGDSRTTELTSENLIVTDRIYLIGDAKMRL